MTIQEILTQYQTASAAWEQALQDYSATQLIAKPSDEGWSIGQVYMHILSSALRFHGKQVEICLQSSENSNGEAQPFMAAVFAKGEMPPDPVRVPPSPQYTPSQPESVAQIEALFAEVDSMMVKLATSIEEAVKSGKTLGKTQHPRFGFLGAQDWFHILAMHWHHHFHQKGRIDAYLKEKAIA